MLTFISSRNLYNENHYMFSHDISQKNTKNFPLFFTYVLGFSKHQNNKKYFTLKAYYTLWGKMPDLQRQKIENMSIFLALWIYLMLVIANSPFLIKHCTFNEL